MIDDPRLPDRFWSKVSPEPNSGCWLWTGAVTVGYGRFHTDPRRDNGRLRLDLAHRVSYRSLIGPIPDGLHIDHLCRTPSCVNPAHLEPVTCGENTRRGLAPQAARDRFASMTHCLRGHEFTPENTNVLSDGERQCRTCNRDRCREWHAKRRLR